jgi:hypothetical protein
MDPGMDFFFTPKMLAAVCIMLLGAGIAYAVFAPEKKPPGPEHRFLAAMQDKCMAAANSRGHYDQPAGKFECWRKPFMRHPKLIFTEQYDASKYEVKK